MKNKDKNFLNFFKGLLMGICDLIPGISGGTIALITGIYDKLINNVKIILSKKFFIKKERTKIEFKFLGFLLLGIFAAILSGSHIISYLLENQTNFLFSFFIGLITASSFLIFKDVKKINVKNNLFSLFGIFFGIVLSLGTPSHITDPSTLYVFIGGFFAIFAMLMPGISGSLILLMLGLYEVIITYIKDLNLIKLFPFAIGAIIGAATISRLISYLFKKDKDKTLMTLLGIVLGSLMGLFLKIEINFNSILFIGIGITSVLMLEYITKNN